MTTADAKTLVGIIRAAELENDIVLIDVEGSANMTVPVAIAHAHYVAIPANPSAADVEDAIETVALVNDIPNTSGGPPVHAVLWTRVPTTGFRTGEFTALVKQLDEAGIPVCPVVLSERSAHKSLISYRTTLDRLPKDEVPSLDKARDEGRALADVISTAVVSAQEKAA